MPAPGGPVTGNPGGTGGGSSFLKRLFGARVPEPPGDPVPGIGGYDYPPGPAGQTGYPGSTSARRTNSALARKNMGPPPGQTGSFGGGIGTPNVPVTAQQQHRQDQAGEFHGGLPKGGSSAATFVGRQYQDTEHRYRPVHGHPEQIPVRNTMYVQGNLPGAPASSGPMGTSVPAGPNRYVAVEGEFTSFYEALERKIPYDAKGRGTPVPGQGRNVRGAILDGIRFGLSPPVMVPQRQGYGTARTRQGNRPTVFSEPPPWSARFYDTTAATGGPDQAGTAAPVQQVYVSPAVPRQGGSWRRGG